MDLRYLGTEVWERLLRSVPNDTIRLYRLHVIGKLDSGDVRWSPC
jgi:hypothetical protein